MRKVNFHTLDRLTVPPELLEKAMAIPHAETPSVSPPVRRTRLIAAAASAVLVTAAGIAAFLLIGNKSLPVKPVIPVTETVSAGNTEPTVPTDGAHADPFSEPTSEQRTPTDAAVDPTAQPPVIPSASEPISERQSESPSEAPSTAPTERASSAEPPTQRATESPTAAPVTDPTETEPPPTDAPPDGQPAEPVPGTPAESRIYFYVYNDTLSGSGRIFCVLYDLAGNRVDEEEILSEEHQAVIDTVYEDFTYFIYCPPEKWELKTAMYQTEIYNEDGELIQTTIVFLE